MQLNKFAKNWTKTISLGSEKEKQIILPIIRAIDALPIMTSWISLLSYEFFNSQIIYDGMSTKTV